MSTIGVLYIKMQRVLGNEEGIRQGEKERAGKQVEDEEDIADDERLRE